MTNEIRKEVAKLGGIVKAAEAVGVSKSQIGACCVAGVVPSLATALAIADAADMTEIEAIAFFRAVAPVLRGKAH